MDEALDIAAALCRQYEGLRLQPYICPAGYPTIGYGTVYKPNRTMVSLSDDPITKETAEEWLLSELKNNYLINVIKASPSLVTTPKALGAITDFAYNLGVARYRASTLRRKINDGDWEAARYELMRWTRGGGRVLPGLVKRRKAELAFLMEL